MPRSKLILSTTDKYEEKVNIVEHTNFTDNLPLKGVYPSDTYYIESKHQNVLSGCRPVSYTYPT